MKNIIKYWPILKYDLLSLLKTVLIIGIILGLTFGFFWVVAALGLEMVMSIAAWAFVLFMIVVVVYMYFKDLPNRLRDKEFKESFDRNYYAREQAEREERERQRNAEH